jgi:hypothetical protein
MSSPNLDLVKVSEGKAKTEGRRAKEKGKRQKAEGRTEAAGNREPGTENQPWCTVSSLLSFSFFALTLFALRKRSAGDGRDDLGLMGGLGLISALTFDRSWQTL